MLNKTLKTLLILVISLGLVACAEEGKSLRVGAKPFAESMILAEMIAQMAEAEGIPVQTFKVSFDEVDRAILEGNEEGFVKIHVRKGSDQILGATIVAEHAGEMISEITLAIVSRVGLGTLSSVIHPYPTQAEAIRKAGDAYNRTRLTPFVKTIFGSWLGWTR